MEVPSGKRSGSIDDATDRMEGHWDDPRLAKHDVRERGLDRGTDRI